jgi:GntR family transcriptional regulator
VDPRNPLPVFEQVAEQLCSDIASGVHAPGESVPSVRAMATRLLINPNTVTRAYELLEREGILEARAGLGMFVTPKAAARAAVLAERSVQANLARGVRVGVAAKLARARIDEAYRRAWGGKDGSEA